MRILVVFIDMLRPDLCRTFEPTSEGGPIDGFFDELGGTAFRRAFTPSPITSRSIASFWTGLYPSAAGSARLTHWPRDFIPDEIPTIFSTFDAAGYSLHCFLNRNEKAYGLLPSNWHERVHLNDSYDLGQFASEIPKRDKQLVFVSLLDVHWFMTDHGYTNENFVASQKIPVRALANADRSMPFDEFDHIVIFSDHGFEEGQWFHCPWEKRLARSKTGIALFWKHKGQRGLSADNHLRSIVDIAPTLCEVAGLRLGPSDGLSLFGTHGHEYIVHEDTFDLAASGIHAEPDLWGATFRDGYATLHKGKLQLNAPSEISRREKLGADVYLAQLARAIAAKSAALSQVLRDNAANERQEAAKAHFRAEGGYPDPIFADGTPTSAWQSFLSPPASKAGPSLDELVRIASTTLQANRPADAHATLKQAIALAPSHADATYMRGIVLYVSAGPAAAALIFMRAALMAPDNALISAAAGRVCNEAKRLEAAGRFIRRSLVIEPGQVDLVQPLRQIQSILHTRARGRADPDFLGRTYDSLGPTLAPNPYAQRLAEWVLPLLGREHVRNGKRLLDIGCGTGPVGDEFHHSFADIVGCDMSAKSLRIAAAKGHYSRLVQSDILAFLRDEPAGGYDLVTAGGSFCYFGDLSELLTQFRKVLRPGGLAAFTIFRSDLPEPESDSNWEIYGIFKHSETYVRRVAQDTGFIIEAVGRDLRIFDQGKRDIVDDLYVLSLPREA